MAAWYEIARVRAQTSRSRVYCAEQSQFSMVYQAAYDSVMVMQCYCFRFEHSTRVLQLTFDT